MNSLMRRVSSKSPNTFETLLSRLLQGCQRAVLNGEEPWYPSVEDRVHELGLNLWPTFSGHGIEILLPSHCSCEVGILHLPGRQGGALCFMPHPVSTYGHERGQQIRLKDVFGRWAIISTPEIHPIQPQRFR